MPATATPASSNISPTSTLVSANTVTVTSVTVQLFHKLFTKYKTAPKDSTTATSSMNNGTVGIIVGCVIGGIVLLILGIGAAHYAYQRRRKFDLAESARACGEVSNVR